MNLVDTVSQQHSVIMNLQSHVISLQGQLSAWQCWYADRCSFDASVQASSEIQKTGLPVQLDTCDDAAQQMLEALSLMVQQKNEIFEVALDEGNRKVRERFSQLAADVETLELAVKVDPNLEKFERLEEKICDLYMKIKGISISTEV